MLDKNVVLKILNKNIKQDARIPHQFPMAIVRDYFHELEEIIEDMEKDVLKEWDKRIERLVKKMDAPPDDIEDILNQLRRIHEIPTEKAEGIANDMVKKTRKFSINQVDDQIESIAGVRPTLRHPRISNAVKTSIKENVRLIKTIPEKYHEEIERYVHQGALKGQSLSKIRDNITAASRKTTNNAMLIARDQVGNVMATITKERQLQAGVEHYTWSSTGDNRVRDTHEEFDGNRYSWKGGSPEGHPGEPIQCRCVAIPDKAEILKNFGNKELPAEQGAVVDRDGYIDKETVNDQVQYMDFDEEYQYKMDIADEASDKRIAQINQSDFDSAEIPYNIADDDYVEYKNIFLNQKNEWVRYTDDEYAIAFPPEFREYFEKFNSLNNLEEQREYIDDTLKGLIDEIDDRYNKEKLKSITECFTDEVKAKKASYMDEIRDTIFHKKNPHGELTIEHMNRVTDIRDELDEGIGFYEKYMDDSINLTPKDMSVIRGSKEVDYEMAVKTIGKGKRCFAYSRSGEINIAKDADVYSVVHEAGHVVHRVSNEKVNKAVDKFFRDRIEGVELTRIYPNSKGNKEKGYDAFFDHYAGKVYNKNEEYQGNEIVSMGAEKIYKEPIEFKEIDKEHYNLIYAILEGLF